MNNCWFVLVFLIGLLIGITKYKLNSVERFIFQFVYYKKCKFISWTGEFSIRKNETGNAVLI